MSLRILIISFNTRELTLACLRSVFEQTRETAFEVIVVDNASEDGSTDAIEAEFGGRVRLIRSAENLGFAAGNNLGVGEIAKRKAKSEHGGEWLLLLNPDTVVLDGAIDRLVAFAEGRPGHGIYGGRTVFADGRLNPASCWGRPTPWSVLCQGVGLASVFRRSGVLNPEGYGGWGRDSVREVDIVSGCFLLIRRELWEELGGFDPTFFMYGEDADLCLRARGLGARPIVTPEATIVHYGGASERVRADKVVRLLAAKVQLLRRHWRPRLVPVGVTLLKAWPFSRAMVWGALSLGCRRSPLGKARDWWSVWVRRGEWAGGGGT